LIKGETVQLCVPVGGVALPTGQPGPADVVVVAVVVPEGVVVSPAPALTVAVNTPAPIVATVIVPEKTLVPVAVNVAPTFGEAPVKVPDSGAVKSTDEPADELTEVTV
jgi:hypothetical protein